MERVRIGSHEVSRLIIGGNPFSGFSHQGRGKDREMVAYYTPDRIKATLREAESLGVNTAILRADDHIRDIMAEYWQEGGRIQWFGQTAGELGPPQVSLERMVEAGAQGCHIHGGVADNLLANGRMEELIPAVEYARRAGLAIGLAGHRPETIRWGEEHLDLDYYMCCYYNPIPREEVAVHRSGTEELYREEDRRAMTETIRTLSRPVIHYKILAAGRNDPRQAFAYAARHMRAGDAVCVGVYTAEKPDMLREDVALLDEGLAAARAAGSAAAAVGRTR
jgi:hypothetical protein